MSTFVSRLIDNFKSYLNGDPKYRRGDGQIVIAARDLEQLLDDYHRLDSHFRRQHELFHEDHNCDHLISIVGGSQQERQGLANALLLQMIVMGYSASGRTPTWMEGETYLRLKNENKIVVPDDATPERQYNPLSWPVKRPVGLGIPAQDHFNQLDPLDYYRRTGRTPP